MLAKRLWVKGPLGEKFDQRFMDPSTVGKPFQFDLMQCLLISHLQPVTSGLMGIVQAVVVGLASQ